MKGPLRGLAELVLSRVWLPGRNARAVFTYHDISSPGSPGYSPAYSTPPELFRRQLELLTRHFHFVTLNELLRSPEDKPLASLTFDDGFRSVQENARDFLRARGIPYAIFANRSAVEKGLLDYGPEYPELGRPGGQRLYLDGAELRRLQAEGVEIGSHGCSHAALARLNPGEARAEIHGNQRFLRELLGAPALSFAFPFGKPSHFTRENERQCREAGHERLFSTEPRLLRPGAVDAETLVLPRISVTQESERGLRYLLNRAWLRGFARSGPIFVVYSGLTARDPAIEAPLAALRRRGFDMRVLVLAPRADSEFERGLVTAGVPAEHVPYRSKRSLPGAVLRVAWRLRQAGAAVVHAHLLDANLVGLSAGWLARIPRRYYTRHHSNQNHVLFPHAVYYDLLSNRLATRVIAISENVRNFLRTVEHVPEAKLTLNPHGFNLALYGPVDPARVANVRTRHGIPEGRPVIGMFSRYIAWKGLQVALPAFEEVLRAAPGAFFVFANAYPSAFRREVLAPLFARLPPGSFVEIEHEPDTEALYQALDVFVHVPQDAVCEAFGLVYVEALLCGIPSVFTLSGIAPEFVEHERNALVVGFGRPAEIAAAVLRLLRDPALRARLAREGRRSVEERFRLEHNLRTLEGLYR